MSRQNFTESDDAVPPSSSSAKNLGSEEREPERANPKFKRKGNEAKKNFRGNSRKPEPKLWAREKAIWEDFIRKHKADLKNAKPHTDASAPKLNVSNIYDVELLNGLYQGLKTAFEFNQIMVKNLYEVNVTPGKTSTFDYSAVKNPKSNYADRKEAAKYIEKQNHSMAKMIKSAKTRLENVREHAEWWKKHEATLEFTCQFPLFWKVKKKEDPTIEAAPPMSHFSQYVTEKSSKYQDKRPRVFLEIAIKNFGVVGKMVVMLYSDYVPLTVKNFLAFCDPKAKLTYKGNFFYFVFQNYYCQTGDVVENRGYGGTSIYGPYFGNEDMTLKHGERGVLTMYTKLPNRNESQFLITFKKLESLDGHNVVFGKVIKGFHILDAIESLGSKKTGRPRVQIFISDCDEI